MKNFNRIFTGLTLILFAACTDPGQAGSASGTDRRQSEKPAPETFPDDEAKRERLSAYGEKLRFLDRLKDIDKAYAKKQILTEGLPTFLRFVELAEELGAWNEMIRGFDFYEKYVFGFGEACTERENLDSDGIYVAKYLQAYRKADRTEEASIRIKYYLSRLEYCRSVIRLRAGPSEPDVARFGANEPVPDGEIQAALSAKGLADQFQPTRPTVEQRIEFLKKNTAHIE